MIQWWSNHHWSNRQFLSIINRIVIIHCQLSIYSDYSWDYSWVYLYQFYFIEWLSMGSMIHSMARPFIHENPKIWISHWNHLIPMTEQSPWMTGMKRQFYLTMFALEWWQVSLSSPKSLSPVNFQRNGIIPFYDPWDHDTLLQKNNGVYIYIWFHEI